jgi:integrase/recombinase XerD
VTGIALSTPAAASVPTPALGSAADRFARNTLRKSAQTQRTYLSVYQRFAAHLAELTGDPTPPPSAFSADAVASYLDRLEAQGRAKSTVRKERAALNRLARHLQLIGAIDTIAYNEITAVEAATTNGAAKIRPALDQATWERVKDRAAARALELDPSGRASGPVALRDLAIVSVLGGLGLRSEELRRLRWADLAAQRRGSSTPWLHVRGKGGRERRLPIPPDVQRALRAWEHAVPEEVASNPLMFPRLGRRAADGSFPEASPNSPPLSSTALMNVVKPIMLAAGVADDQAHPHVLRHTFATLYLARRGHRADALVHLQQLLGHASLDTTRGYLHPSDEDLAQAMLDRDGSLLDAAATARARRNERRGARRPADTARES